MRLHRFYYKAQIGDKKEIFIENNPLIHQWKNVFRLKPADKVILFDNSGFEYLAEIVLISKDETRIKILEVKDKKVESSEKPDVRLFAALIKKDNFELIIQKATELGVSEITPIISDRSEKKDLNMERAEKIIIEASEQSGRVLLPILNKPQKLEEALDEINMNFVSFNPEGESLKSGDNLKALKEKGPIGLLIGPEGGWSDKEIELFKSKNIPIYNLGSQILRAETAAIAISGLFLLS